MRKLAFLCASAFLVAGCFFTDESDSSTPSIRENTKTQDSLARAKLINPGMYAGDYTWIDSNKHGLESEFILDANGGYRLFWISENEAVYDQRGEWFQKDSSIYFHSVKEAWVASGVFDDYAGIEDDTNSIMRVSPNSFMRKEWTPLRQKPYWITYTRKEYPQLKEGRYLMEKKYGSDSDSTAVNYKFVIDLTAKTFNFSVIQDTLPYFQADAKFYQVGSFLATEENRQRELDTTNILGQWEPSTGAILKRLQTVNDSSFNMWSPASFFEAGTWDAYVKSRP